MPTADGSSSLGSGGNSSSGSGGGLEHRTSEDCIRERVDLVNRSRDCLQAMSGKRWDLRWFPYPYVYSYVRSRSRGYKGLSTTMPTLHTLQNAELTGSAVAQKHIFETPFLQLDRDLSDSTA